MRATPNTLAASLETPQPACPGTPSSGISSVLKQVLFLSPLLGSVPSFGQTTVDNTDASKPQDNQEGEIVQLDPMEVSATKTTGLSSSKFTQPVLDVPQTITLIPRQVFEQQGATTLRDVLRNSPGITFSAGEGGTPNGDQMVIRGFDARNDILIDGIRDAGTYTRDAFNLEQVEVTKGPSSAMSGRGSTGASVNLVSKTPKLEDFRSGTVSVGNADYKRGTIDINQTLHSESAPAGTAFRFNGMWQDSGVPGRDIVENKQWAIAPSLAFGLGTATRVTFSYLHAEQDNIPDYGIPWSSTGTPAPVDQSNWYGLVDRDYEKIKNDVGTISIERDLSSETTLRNITRYNVTNRDSVITAPRFVSGSTTTVRRDDWKDRDQVDTNFSNQTNLTTSFETGPFTHEISTGLELSRETSKRYSRDFPAGTVFPTTSLENPNPYDPFPYELSRTGEVAVSKADSIGVYLFDTVKLSDKWELNGGLRAERFDVEYTPAGGTQLSRTDDMVSYKAGLVYKPRTNGSVYFGYGTAFNPSAEGLTLSGTSGTADLPPEESRSYELGTKWDLFEGNLSLSGALFRTEKFNARTRASNSDPYELAGDQVVQGFELGATGKLSHSWTVFAGYAYQSSETTHSDNASELGLALAKTPENTFNIWTSYVMPFGLTIGGGAQYSSEVNSNSTATRSAPAYTLYNAMAQYEVSENLSLRLNINNLTDEDYVDRVGGGHYIPGAGRSVILSATFNF